MIHKIYGKKREKKESPPKKIESRLQVSTNGREAKMPWAELAPASQPIRKASLFFGGRSEKRLGRSSPPQNSSIGGRMHSEEEGEETLLTSL